VLFTHRVGEQSAMMHGLNTAHPWFVTMSSLLIFSSCFPLMLTNSPQNQSELLSVVQAELSVLQDRLASVTHDLETTTAELELARERVSDLEDRLDQELVQARQAQQVRIFDFSFCSYCCYLSVSLSLSSCWC
jgi:hypothetical protein